MVIDFGAIIMYVLWISLIIFSSWFLFRTFAFIKAIGSINKIKKKVYYFTELFYLIVLIAITLVLAYMISLGSLEMYPLTQTIFMILAGIFIIYVIIQGFLFPLEDTLNFINNIDSILKKRFNGVVMSSVGYLWTHLIGISEFSKNPTYRHIENTFKIFVNIGLIGIISSIIGLILLNLKIIADLPLFFIFIIIFGILSIISINRMNKRTN